MKKKQKTKTNEKIIRVLVQKWLNGCQRPAEETMTHKHFSTRTQSGVHPLLCCWDVKRDFIKTLFTDLMLAFLTSRPHFCYALQFGLPKKSLSARCIYDIFFKVWQTLSQTISYNLNLWCSNCKYLLWKTALFVSFFVNFVFIIGFQTLFCIVCFLLTLFWPLEKFYFRVFFAVLLWSIVLKQFRPHVYVDSVG